MEQWPPGFLGDQAPNMLLLELIPIAIAIQRFARRFATKRVRVHTDNMGVVEALNRASCKCKLSMPLVRLIFLRAIQHQFQLTAVHVPTKRNTDADLLSCLQEQRFLKRNPASVGRRFSPSRRLWPISSDLLITLRLQGLH